MASDVSEAKTVLQYMTKSQSETYMEQEGHPIYSNSREIQCGYLPMKGVNIARCCVNGYSITAARAESVTHVSF